MRKLLFSLLLLPLLCAGLPAAEDCSKSLDACSGASKKSSPFVEASLREAPTPAPDAANTNRAVPREAPAVTAPAPAQEPVSPADPEAPAAPAKRPLSSPLWTLFAGAVLAGVYFYLSAGRKKGRRR